MIQRVAIAAMIVIAASCSDDEPAYPIEPQIEFRELRFVAGEKVYDKDTLAIRFYYTDGDMDLGLSGTEITAPYHRINYFLAEKGIVSRVATKPKPFSWQGNVLIDPTPSDRGKLVTHRTRKEPGYETLPDYDCRHYTVYDTLYVTQEHAAMIGDCFVDREDGGPWPPKIYAIYDTLLKEENPNHYNLDVEYFVQQPDGSFALQDFKNDKCFGQGFKARFPEIYKITSHRLRHGSFEILRETQNTGVIEYSMATVGHQALFGGKKIKLRITIRDRALHVSNTIETPLIEIPSM